MDYLSGLDVLNSLGLLKFESNCYREICLVMLKSREKTSKYALHGEAPGYDSFMFGMLMSEFCVLVYEGLRLLSLKTDIEDILSDAPNDFYENLKLIRNNHHLYNKYAPYSDKVFSILNQRQKDKTDIVDQYNALRYDISLVYQIVRAGKILIGSDITFEHIYKHETNLIGIGLRDFNQYLSSLVTTFSQFDFVKTPDLPDNVVIPSPIQIELFDDRIVKVFGVEKLFQPTYFRMLIILSKLSFVDILLDTMVNHDALISSPEWVFFFLRFISTTYDEAYDSISNLYKYHHANDEITESVFAAFSRNQYHIENADMAQKLRNMLHYAGNTSRIIFDDNITTINVFKLYSTRTNIATWDVAFELFESLRAEIKLWLCELRNIFST